MARDFNQNRIANAKLISADIDKFGKTFAIQSPWNADGFSSVNVTVEQTPSDIKQYLEGNNSITVYPVPSNVDKLCEYALASFPNIEDLYLFKTSAIVVLEDDLSYLLDLNKIYVPTDLLGAYQSAYPTIASKFDIIVEDYTLTIPFVGETTLTSEYVDSVIAMLSNAEKNAITKVVIPTDFSEESADEIAWEYDFSVLANLDNNIWYGATQYNFTTLTISGSGTLTSAIVESAIASIPSGKLSGITKVVVSDEFTVCETNAFSGLSTFTNLEKVEYDFYLTDYNFSYSNFGFPSSVSEFTVKFHTTNPRINLANNSNLKKLVIYGNNKQLETGLNVGNAITNTQIEELYINESVSIWGNVTFAYNTELKKVHFDNTFTGIFEGGNAFANAGINVGGTKFWFNNSSVITINDSSHFPASGKYYFPSDILSSMMVETNWADKSSSMTGFFTYNGTLPTFTGYTPTFYEDEDCTITIVEQDMVVGTQYYVKLTAI